MIIACTWQVSCILARPESRKQLGPRTAAHGRPSRALRARTPSVRARSLCCVGQGPRSGTGTRVRLRARMHDTPPMFGVFVCFVHPHSHHLPRPPKGAGRVCEVSAPEPGVSAEMGKRGGQGWWVGGPGDGERVTEADCVRVRSPAGTKGVGENSRGMLAEVEGVVGEWGGGAWRAESMHARFGKMGGG